MITEQLIPPVMCKRSGVKTQGGIGHDHIVGVVKIWPAHSVASYAMVTKLARIA